MTKGLIIFDMDGTLIDSSVDITISVNYVRKHFGLPKLDIPTVVDIINGKREELAYNLYQVREYTSTHRKLFEEHYIEQCTKNTYVYKGVEELLKELKSLGYTLSVATNAYTKFAEKMLTHLNIDRYFDLIVGACKVEKPKPNPDMLFHIMGKFSNSSINIMVGDNHTDVYAAKNANIDMVFAGWGFGKIENYADVTFVAKTPYDMLNYIV
ncbi:MAG: HAD-IA family hydrolase [Deferribacterales bacterium]